MEQQKNFWQLLLKNLCITFSLLCMIAAISLVLYYQTIEKINVLGQTIIALWGIILMLISLGLSTFAIFIKIKS